MRTIVATHNIVYIGRAGETNATKIIFPLPPDWEDATKDNLLLLFKLPHKHVAYVYEVSVVDNTAVWLVPGDCTVAGIGRMQLTLLNGTISSSDIVNKYRDGEFSINGMVRKSRIYDTQCKHSLNEEADPPEPHPSWIDKILEIWIRWKNNTLYTAGHGIHISEDHVISATGGGGGDYIEGDHIKFGTDNSINVDDFATEEDIENLFS